METTNSQTHCIYTINAGTFKDVRICELKKYFQTRQIIVSQSSNSNNRNYNVAVSKSIREAGWNENMIKIKSIGSEKDMISEMIKERQWLGLDIKPINAADEILKDEEKEKYLKMLKERNEKMKAKQEAAKDTYKEVAKEKAKEKIICECGGHYTYSNKNTHLSSGKHIKWLERPESSPFKPTV